MTRATSYRVAALATAALLLACTACTPATGAVVAPSGPSDHPTDRSAPSTLKSSTLLATPATPTRASESAAFAPGAATSFTLDGAQAREVATVVEFLDAYNSGNVDGALALFADSPTVVFSACRYRTGEALEGAGKKMVKSWLSEAAAEHSRITLGSIQDPNKTRPVGVLGVSISRQTSDTIRQGGYPAGITPALAVKVIFDRSGKIQRFAAGPSGGSQAFCELPKH